MSYNYTIQPREIFISPSALQKIYWEHDFLLSTPENLISFLERECSISAELLGYDIDDTPVFSFEVMTFSTPEHEGIDGVIKRLKQNLRYAESQTFEIYDENGRYKKYEHLGFDYRGDI